MSFKKVALVILVCLLLGAVTAVVTDMLIVRPLNGYAKCLETGRPRYPLKSCSEEAVSESGWPFTSSYTLANGQRKVFRAQFSTSFEIEPDWSKSYDRGSQYVYNTLILGLFYVPIVLIIDSFIKKNRRQTNS